MTSVEKRIIKSDHPGADSDTENDEDDDDDEDNTGNKNTLEITENDENIIGPSKLNETHSGKSLKMEVDDQNVTPESNTNISNISEEGEDMEED